jgi:outer membrane lipoprotein SlyB
MDTQGSKPNNPLMWAAGVAVILFCGVGTAAMMGWIPMTLSRTPDAVPAATERVPVTQMGSTQPAAAPRARSSYEPRTEPVMAAAAPRVPMKCTDCGVIESTREVSTRGEASGLGAVGGAVVGGVLGNQVGSGSGKQIATVVGAVGGVIAGNEIEKRVKATKSYEVTVRFDDGSSRVLTQSAAPSWGAGDRVRIVDGALQSN